MKNSIQDGKILDLVNDSGGDLSAGEGLVFGENLGVAVTDVASGDTGAFAMEGVFDMLAEDADVWAAGDTLYYDPATKRITDVAGALKKAGYALEAKAASTDAKSKIKLVEKLA